MIHTQYGYIESDYDEILMVLIPLIALITIVAMWRIFEKAGEPGWAALIPFYSAYVLFKISWGNGWLFLLSLIPIVQIIILIITMFKLATSFRKNGGFAIGLILLNVIFYCILAFDQSTYLGVPQDA